MRNIPNAKFPSSLSPSFTFFTSYHKTLTNNCKCLLNVKQSKCEVERHTSYIQIVLKKKKKRQKNENEKGYV